MRRLFLVKYPKIIALVLAFVLSYLIFMNPFVKDFVHSMGDWGYFGIFLAGVFSSFGFSAPFSAGFFLVVEVSNLPLAIFVGAIGAVLADILIFKFIQFSFMDEFERLERTPYFKYFRKLFHKEFGHRLRVLILYAFAGIAIASPLPDEIGITMMAGLKLVNIKEFGLISFILKGIGIWVLLIL
jgi:hypothetical protein